MVYRVVYETQAARIKASLPPLARAALASQVRKIAADPWNHGRGYSGGARCCPFGFGKNKGLVVYRVQDTVLLITVVDATWAG